MVSANIEGVGMDPQSGSFIVMLKAEGKVVPMVIGPLEAQNFMVHLSGQRPPRPLGPDLFLNTLDLLGVKVLRVEVVELKDSTFFAKLILEQRGMEYEIDARPSDSMALAIRAEVPILLAEQILQDAGIDEANVHQGEIPKA
jgi:hypothetical protein